MLTNGLSFTCSINLHVKKGQLLAVVGPVGAGKTSLISAVLGEMQKISGTVAFKVCIAFHIHIYSDYYTTLEDFTKFYLSQYKATGL